VKTHEWATDEEVWVIRIRERDDCETGVAGPKMEDKRASAQIWFMILDADGWVLMVDEFERR